MLKTILKHEGYYVNDPDDLGGETFCGITRKNYSKCKFWEAIDNEVRPNIKKSSESNSSKNTFTLARQKAIAKEYENEIAAVYKPYIDKALQLNKLLKDGSISTAKGIALFLVNAGLNRLTISNGRLLIRYGTGKIENKNLIEDRKQLLSGIHRYYQYIINKRPTNAKFAKGWCRRLNDSFETTIFNEANLCKKL